MVAEDVDRVLPGDPVDRVMVWPVAEVDERETLVRVAEALAAGEVGTVAVLAGGRLVGLVSERDVVTHLAAGTELAHLTAGEVMTTEVVSARRGDSILAAARLMREAGVRHLPVLSGDQVAGIVSMRDLLGVLVADADAEGERVPGASPAGS